MTIATATDIETARRAAVLAWILPWKAAVEEWDAHIEDQWAGRLVLLKKETNKTGARIFGSAIDDLKYSGGRLVRDGEGLRKINDFRRFRDREYRLWMRKAEKIMGALRSKEGDALGLNTGGMLARARAQLQKKAADAAEAARRHEEDQKKALLLMMFPVQWYVEETLPGNPALVNVPLRGPEGEALPPAAPIPLPPAPPGRPPIVKIPPVVMDKEMEELNVPPEVITEITPEMLEEAMKTIIENGITVPPAKLEKIEQIVSDVLIYGYDFSKEELWNAEEWAWGENVLMWLSLSIRPNRNNIEAALFARLTRAQMGKAAGFELSQSHQANLGASYKVHLRAQMRQNLDELGRRLGWTDRVVLDGAGEKPPRVLNKAESAAERTANLGKHPNDHGYGISIPENFHGETRAAMEDLK